MFRHYENSKPVTNCELSLRSLALMFYECPIAIVYTERKKILSSLFFCSNQCINKLKKFFCKKRSENV